MPTNFHHSFATMDASARNENRQSHIGIRLGHCVAGQWETIEALGWSDTGFNFYSRQETVSSPMELKRGLTRFEGTVMWKSGHTDDTVILEALVNTQIYQRAQEVVSSNTALHKRLIRLMRTPAMVEEKKGMLASLGVQLSDSDWTHMVQRQKQEHPMFQYGVKVESQGWAAIVANARQVSEVLVSMEQWSQALAPGQSNQSG